jgi:hypothetical protein
MQVDVLPCKHKRCFARLRETLAKPPKTLHSSAVFLFIRQAVRAALSASVIFSQHISSNLMAKKYLPSKTNLIATQHQATGAEQRSLLMA